MRTMLQRGAGVHRDAGRIGRLLSIGAVAAAFAAGSTGCDNAGQGALSGAGLGALAGMGIGSIYGDMGKGAAIGAIAGGLGGLFVGDQNARRSRGNDF